MSKLGSLLLVAGLISCVVTLVGYEHKYLMWIEKWGTEAAWGIRGGVVVLGLLLLVAGRKGSDKKK